MTKKILFFAATALTLLACSGSDSQNEQVVPSSSSNIATDQSSSSEVPSGGLCYDFIEGTPREHQGKNKAQFCDPRDGTKYVYVNIGNQTWMAENLKYSANGTMGRCFRNLPENCNNYGRLYKLDEMFCSSGCTELQGGVANPNDHSVNIACPIGWHLPSTTELEELLTYADPNFVPGSEASGNGKNSSATKLKVSSWGGTDDFGFSSLPSGFCGGGCPDGRERWTTKYPSTTVDPIESTFWWSHAYGAPVPLAKSWHMNTTAVVDDAYQSYSTSAFYTRCLKDKTQTAKTPEPKPEISSHWENYFTDVRDGKQYPYVTIGTQTWMAANLDYVAEGSKCYNDLPDNCDTYGRLYNHETAVTACPSGWHLPTNDEWATLITTIGGLVGTAEKLKAKSGWVQNGTDDYGFAALPGSYGNLRSGNYGSITEFGSARSGFWWSATEQAANGAAIRHIGPTSGNITNVDNDISRLYSVRCVK
jgi:uncharacterized protein (TIGR02145 family)